MSQSETIFSAEADQQVVVMSRNFDAPPDLVFKAYTDPQLVPRWWGPARLTTTVDSLDLRPGGTWRFVQKDVDGTEHVFHGVYHEVQPPSRLVATFEYGGAPGHVLLQTMTFEGVDGGTKLTTRSVFSSMDDRDAMVASGMRDGATESMERLSALLQAR
jgi:uncharacterized protein YndB with AHSA1/START domain